MMKSGESPMDFYESGGAGSKAGLRDTMLRKSDLLIQLQNHRHSEEAAVAYAEREQIQIQHQEEHEVNDASTAQADAAGNTSKAKASIQSIQSPSLGLASPRTSSRLLKRNPPTPIRASLGYTTLSSPGRSQSSSYISSPNDTALLDLSKSDGTDKCLFLPSYEWQQIQLWQEPLPWRGLEINRETKMARIPDPMQAIMQVPSLSRTIRAMVKRTDTVQRVKEIIVANWPADEVSSPTGKPLANNILLVYNAHVLQDNATAEEIALYFIHKEIQIIVTTITPILDPVSSQVELQYNQVVADLAAIGSSIKQSLRSCDRHLVEVAGSVVTQPIVDAVIDSDRCDQLVKIIRSMRLKISQCEKLIAEF